jgi:translation initiation factor 1
MDSRRTFRSLAQLSELLPESTTQAPAQATVSGVTQHNGKGNTVRVSVDKKGRKGKTVTIVAGLRHNPETLEEISRTLKQHCGAGGTVKEGNIEIQGDNRVRVAEKLRAMNYVVT